MAKKSGTKTRQKSDAPFGASELAAMVYALRQAHKELPILGDFLEERLGLGATAALFRLPELKDMPKRCQVEGDFVSFLLTADVFLWLAEGVEYPRSQSAGVKPFTIIGLYAHPEGAKDRWCKITRVLVGAYDPDAPRQYAWERVARRDPRLEAARKELAAHAGKQKKR